MIQAHHGTIKGVIAINTNHSNTHIQYVMIRINLLFLSLTRHLLMLYTDHVLRGTPRHGSQAIKYSVFVRYMDPPQAEFLAENLPISIRPNFSSNKICLISVSVITYSNWYSATPCRVILGRSTHSWPSTCRYGWALI